MTLPDEISSNISGEDIKDAIQSGEIKERGREEDGKRKAITRVMIYKDKQYSPKYVITKAYEVTNNEEIDSESFRTRDAKEFLKDEGFEVSKLDEKLEENLELEGEDIMADQEDKMSREEVNKEYKELVEKGRVEFITFHPSYSYEEFIEGITINSESEDESDLDYMIKDGIFKRLCARALAYAMDLDKDEREKYGNVDKFEDDKNKVLDATKEDDAYNWKSIYDKYRSKLKEYTESYLDEYEGKGLKREEKKEKIEEDLDDEENEKLEAVHKIYWNELSEDPNKRFLLIIDEINRGDISKIFGELITLIEKDKRLGAEEEKIARLTYSSQEFVVPPNVYILGTMNTADRSIAMLDVALRRRFSFEEMYPDKDSYEKLRRKREIHDENEDSVLAKSIKKLKEINENIREEDKLGRDKMIGSSYFYQVKDKEDWDDVKRAWFHEIFPLLEEYCWDDRSLLKDVTDVSDFDIYDSTKRKLNRDEVSLKSWLNIEDQSPDDSESEE